MPNLTKLVQNRAPAAIDFGEGAVLHVEFYPSKITTAMLVDYAAANPAKLADMDEDRILAVLGSPTDILLALLASWDLSETAADGSEQILPIDRPTLAGLGIVIQWTILNGVMNNQQRAAAGEAAASEASASAPASDATSQPTAH